MRPLKNLWPTSVGHRRIKTGWRLKNQCWCRVPSLVTARRKVVGGPGFEKMGVACSWQLGTYKPYPTIFPLHLGGFVRFTLEFGGRAAYMETHPKSPSSVAGACRSIWRVEWSYLRSCDFRLVNLHFHDVVRSVSNAVLGQPYWGRSRVNS